MDEPFDDSCETWTVKHGRPFFYCGRLLQIMDYDAKIRTTLQKEELRNFH